MVWLVGLREFIYKMRFFERLAVALAFFHVNKLHVI
jgi:hypothetical protein